MAVRQAPTDKIGEAGQVAAELFFNDLGWGPLPTNKQDLGTDLFVQLRRDDLTDLGMMLGVQVKTGDSFFRSKTTVRGRAGWWFRESDRRHQSYWSDHHIPHILIMQDKARSKRFWVRLDRSTIQQTKRGIRVFVPEEQTLNLDAARIWTDIVGEARKLQSFEGARWSFNLSQVPAPEWPRYALLASRIVAPHPNQGFAEDINWAEAVALCIQADLHRWDQFAAERVDVPSPEEARALADPGWQFAAAVYDWLKGDAGALLSLEPGSMSPELRVAHAICVSTVLIDRGDWRSAAAKLESVRDTRESSVDQAWLAVHLGWTHFETGRVDEARAMIEESVALHAGFPPSLTNSAIRSAGVLALFDMAPMLTGDVAAAVKASDSTLSWWHTQQIENALNSFLSRSYRRWANDKSITLGGGDATHNDLLSAGLAARLIGNRRSSRYATYLRAMANLTLPNSDHPPAQQLETLRSVGYPKELTLALSRFRSDGSLDVVSEYMADVTITRSTTTSIHADLESLENAGSYVPDNVASDWIRYLLAAFEDPTPFAERFNLNFEPRHEILNALAGLRLHFAVSDERQLLLHVLNLADDTSQLLERPIRRILRSVRKETLEAESFRLSSRGRLLPEASWLGRMLVDVVATFDLAARDAVRDRILAGSISAIPDGFSIDSLSTEEAAAVLNACNAQIRGYVGQFNGIGVGGPDPYRIMALIAVYGPDETRAEAWADIVEAMRESNVIHDRKADAAQVLAKHSHLIPEIHRRDLLETARLLRKQPPSPFASFVSASLTAAAPFFAELYLELEREDEDWRRVLSELLAGESAQRCAAIEVLARRTGHELLLFSLTRESDAEVARTAMYGLAKRATEDSAVADLAVDHLLELIGATGEQSALSIGGGVLAARTRVPEAVPLVTALKTHGSLQIRSLANDLE